MEIIADVLESSEGMLLVDIAISVQRNREVGESVGAGGLQRG